jgi:ornithine cyclodeaminase/alanine dehydrogenase-like protein (mu-crystallin family)
MKLKRRDFLNNAVMVGAGVALAPAMAPAIAWGKKGADSRLRLGLIGVGLRGTWHLKNSLARSDVDVVAICDINPERLDICRQHIEEAGQKKAREFGKGIWQG